MIKAETFCDISQHLSENKLYGNLTPITKIELLALSILATRINGDYVKKGGVSDFVNTIEDGVDTSTYQRVKQSNRFVMETVQQLDPNALTAELLESADQMIRDLELDYMFKVLGDDINDFESSIQQFLADSTEIEIRHHIGVVAYLPTYVVRNAKAKELNERSVASKHVGIKGEKVFLLIEILSKRAATQWDGWNVSAITADGDRVSFFTTKDEIANKKGEFKISAKVKDCGAVWQSPDIKETRLNYVK